MSDDKQELDESAPRQKKRASSPSETVLITGIAGGQGMLLTQRLIDSYRIVGVDRVPWEGHPSKFKMYQLALTLEPVIV